MLSLLWLFMITTNTMIPPALNIAQFAEYIETIKMLYRVDDDFKTLCDDYVTSKMKMETSAGKPLEQRRSELEYEQLARDLEKEIVDYVRKIN